MFSFNKPSHTERLSISPGSSPLRACSSTGVNQGSYLPVISSTITLPASSEPPNSAPLSAKSGIIIISATAKSSATAIFFLLFFIIELSPF